MAEYMSDVPAHLRRDELRRDAALQMQEDHVRRTSGRTTSDVEMELEENSIAVQAAKEVDRERREMDEIAEQMRNRQNYFLVKAQMHSEAADHYKRMNQDIAEMLNNNYLNHANKSQGKDY